MRLSTSSDRLFLDSHFSNRVSSRAQTQRTAIRIERMFGKLKQQRRIATRYDKTILSFESFLTLAATRLWLSSFVNAA